MKRTGLLLLVLALLVSACSAKAPQAHTLTVFAAASLTDAFTEIGDSFETANPGVTVTLNFAGTQALRTQVEQGAVADVFASANTKEMDALVTGNFVAADSARIFLTNQLMVIMPASNPANLTTLNDLSRPGLKIVLAAAEVPVGKYALQVLDNLDASFGLGYKNNVLENVVSYENDVKQVVTKVQLGEADAGIVYSSDAVAAPELRKIEIPVELNVVAKYPIASLSKSTDSELADAFIAYVLSSDGQEILKKWGFYPIQ